MQFLKDISLTDPPVNWLIYGCGIIALLIVLRGLKTKRIMVVSMIWAVTSVLTVLVDKYFIEVVWKPFPDAVPTNVYVAWGIVIFVFLCTLTHSGTRIITAIAVLIAAVCAAGVTNIHYQTYPDVASLNPQPVAKEMNFDEFNATRQAPSDSSGDTGAIVTVPLAGTSSGFPARDAIAYVPPAYWSQPETRLPVLVLMAGNPGQPSDWFESGQVGRVADHYQKTHGGVAPIVISVDGTATFTGNPICVDGPQHKVMTYISRDVPALIKQKFRVNEDQKTWTIGGLSYGGTCSLQIMTNHPDSYGAFLNMSGQAEPTVGNHGDTVKQFFGGNEAAFQAVNPEQLLRTKRYDGIPGRFVAGQGDPLAQKELTHLNDLAVKAGMKTEYFTVEGGHDFKTWRNAIAQHFDWIAQRGGLS